MFQRQIFPGTGFPVLSVIGPVNPAAVKRSGSGLAHDPACVSRDIFIAY
jgi:hypothetical protein